ncbi:MAG TPA: hypothetical protein ENK50_05555 [Sedimenticola sp.]|nr:hypothetical protein [Sedimenticola sp.]
MPGGNISEAKLADLLARIEEADKKQDYDVRYGLVLEAMAVANRLGYAAGYRIDPDEPEWPVAFIELPTGQVSWHMPQHPIPWDGHSTDEKYDRCRRYDSWRLEHVPVIVVTWRTGEMKDAAGSD